MLRQTALLFGVYTECYRKAFYFVFVVNNDTAVFLQLTHIANFHLENYSDTLEFRLIAKN